MEGMGTERQNNRCALEGEAVPAKYEEKVHVVRGKQAKLNQRHHRDLVSDSRAGEEGQRKCNSKRKTDPKKKAGTISNFKQRTKRGEDVLQAQGAMGGQREY